MPIIMPLGRTVKAYLRRFGKRSPELRIACPSCGGKTRHHGRYQRTAVTDRKVYTVPVYRWRCPGCERTVSVLPDFLVPYAQFVSLVREGVLRRWLRNWPVVRIAAEACTASADGLSERTVVRWLARLKQIAGGWAQLLANRLLLARPGSDLFTCGVQWQGPKAPLQALCDLGDLCREQAPSGQGHPGLYAYCSRLLSDLPRL